jgi:plastocyanin
MKETLFYILGIVLAVSAVGVSFVGLKAGKFPGKLMPLVVIWFAVFAVGAGTFAVLYSKEHEEHREHELEHANAEFEAEEHGEPDEEAEENDILKEDEGGTKPQEGAEGHGEVSEEGAEGDQTSGEGGQASGSGGTLEVIASESALEFEETSLETEAGEVEIDFNNPAAIEHDVKIEKDGEEIGGTDIVSGGEDSAKVELEPGDYVFYCSVPGHREAGMEGPLTVK